MITLIAFLLFIISFLLLLVFITSSKLITVSQENKKLSIIISSLQNLSREVYKLTNKTHFMSAMWETLKEVTNADEFTYFVFDGRDTLIPEYVDGVYRNEILKVRLKLGEGFTGRVATTREPAFLNEANKSPISKHIPGTPHEESSLLATPITFNNKLYGAILLTKLQGKKFNKEELKITEIFTNMVASLIASQDYITTIKSGFTGLISVLVKSVELKDTYSAYHSLRVSLISEAIAKEMNLPDAEVYRCKIGGLLHDIGKIGVPEEILKTDKPINVSKSEIILKHPEIGYNLLKKVALLDDVADTVLYHHEWYNGNGYPKGLKGEQIPISSRVVAVADAIDAMYHGRPYSQRKSIDEICIELKRWSSKQFDPNVVLAAIKSRKYIEEIITKEFNEPIEDYGKIFENI